MPFCHFACRQMTWNRRYVVRERLSFVEFTFTYPVLKQQYPIALRASDDVIKTIASWAYDNKCRQP